MYIRGAFSVVKVGINKKTKEKVAIKIIDRNDVGKDYEKNLRMEMDILRRVDHPNIIALHEMVEAGNKLYFVMELYVFTHLCNFLLLPTHLLLGYRVTGGELFDRIVEKGSYSEEDAKILVRKIVSAIDYLHKQNIAHRDLKVGNNLLPFLKNNIVLINSVPLARKSSCQER